MHFPDVGDEVVKALAEPEVELSPARLFLWTASQAMNLISRMTAMMTMIRVRKNSSVIRHHSAVFDDGFQAGECKQQLHAAGLGATRLALFLRELTPFAMAGEKRFDLRP